MKIMSEFIINKDKKQESDHRELEVYTFGNHADYEDDKGFPRLDITNDDNNVFHLPTAHAIKSVTGNVTRYYVKRGKDGILFNPIGMYSEGTEYKKMRQGKAMWELKKTSKRVFEFYIQFLKTKNIAWLNNAERELA
jgi:hypothetical protein